MEFLAIYRADQCENATHLCTYFLAMPMVIEDEAATLKEFHDAGEWYRENITSLEMFLDGEHYDPYELECAGTYQGEFPKLGVNVELSVTAVIPMQDSLVTHKWFALQQPVLKEFWDARLHKGSQEGLKAYLEEKRESDPIRYKVGVVDHFLAGNIQIDYDRSEFGLKNLAITALNLEKTGTVQSCVFAALACFAEDYQQAVQEANQVLEQTLDYRIDYFTHCLRHGTPV